MAGEIDIYGIFIPTLLLYALLAYLILYLCTPLLNRWQLNGWIMMPSAFNLFLYIIIFGSLCTLSAYLIP